MKNEASAVTSDSSSDDDAVSEDEQDNYNNSTRVKRYTEWCGVNTENYPFSETSRRRVVWPPSSSSSSSDYISLRPTRIGNPMLGNKMQMYSKTGYHLAVYPDGRVIGTRDENDFHTYLEVISDEYPEHVKIKGMLTNMYIAMNEDGMLYGEPNPSAKSTVFVETFQGSYNAYLSRKYAHLGWYIGIKKSGKIKKGRKTAYGQRAVRFLPRRSKFE